MVAISQKLTKIWPKNSFLAENKFFIIFLPIFGILLPVSRLEFKTRFNKTYILWKAWFGPFLNFADFFSHLFYADFLKDFENVKN